MNHSSSFQLVRELTKKKAPEARFVLASGVCGLGGIIYDGADALHTRVLRRPGFLRERRF